MRMTTCLIVFACIASLPPGNTLAQSESDGEQEISQVGLLKTIMSYQAHHRESVVQRRQAIREYLERDFDPHELCRNLKILSNSYSEVIVSDKVVTMFWTSAKSYREQPPGILETAGLLKNPSQALSLYEFRTGIIDDLEWLGEPGISGIVWHLYHNDYAPQTEMIRFDGRWISIPAKEQTIDKIRTYVLRALRSLSSRNPELNRKIAQTLIGSRDRDCKRWIQVQKDAIGELRQQMETALDEGSLSNSEFAQLEAAVKKHQREVHKIEFFRRNLEKSIRQLQTDRPSIFATQSSTAR